MQQEPTEPRNPENHEQNQHGRDRRDPSAAPSQVPGRKSSRSEASSAPPLIGLSEQVLIERWQKRQDQEAAAELWRRFCERLFREARNVRDVDSTDASAFRELLSANRPFNYDRDDWMWRLLATIAHNKRISRFRKNKAHSSDSLEAIPEQTISPEEVADYNDKVRQLKEILVPKELDYFELREGGLRQVEIAEKMGLHVRTISRIGVAVQAKVRRLFGDDQDRSPVRR